MTTFNDREKGFEGKFAHDEELAFKTNARCNKLLGLWAAEKLGRKGAEAEAYAREVVTADFESAGDSDVVAKLLKDFKALGVTVTEMEIRKEMGRLLPIAQKQIAGGN